jgi:hypothetical protein
MANLKTTTIDGSLIEKEGTVTLSGTTLAVDLSTGSFFEIDLDNASGTITTFTITNPHASHVSIFKLRIIQGSPARQFDWPACGGGVACSLPQYGTQSSCEAAGGTWGSAMKWPGGTGPTITTTNHMVDVLQFTTWTVGATWYGRVVGQNLG